MKYNYLNLFYYFFSKINLYGCKVIYHIQNMSLFEKMLGIRGLKKELSELNSEIKSISSSIIKLSNDISKNMDNMSTELHETNKALRESMELISNTIKEMSVNFTKTLNEAIINMTEMKIQMNIKDTILKSLGIDNLFSDILKKKKLK